MRYLMFGTGAIGGYFGGRLLQNQHQVDFIARGKQLAAIEANGLQLNSINGSTILNSVNVNEYIMPEVNSGAPYDVIFIAVKSYQLEQAVSEISRICSSNTFVIPLLNGIDIEQRLLKYGLKSHQIITGFANIICKVADYGVIEHSGGEPHITLGVKAGFHTKEALLNIKPMIDKVASDLKSANINVTIKDDITNAVWAKYLFVAPWATISSLVEQPLGHIRENAECYVMLKQLIDEYALIAKAEKSNISDKIIDNIKKGLSNLPSNSKTSMQNDVEQNKTSEFDTLVASALYLSKKHQLNTPILNWCFNCLSVKLLNDPFN
ncbi:ketopantoate reductase family protein [Thalassotalea profundi]|uniref:2-dehydropantoate 2-reductase n=1 Tax=Thalassotalea profundi TaxID=2036687 RepID=A0ABQ3J557_9GAMM|nr:2-dehydropantoate 2-reductase [Thalassotalea profundi]GHF01610.1 2-dehydropantoate 2-reductase [Thalassotalea profundi]